MDSLTIDRQTNAAMKRPFWTALFVCWIFIGATCLAKGDTLKDVSQLELKGQFKEAAGAVTGNERLKAEGRADKTKASLMRAAHRMRGTGMDYYSSSANPA